MRGARLIMAVAALAGLVACAPREGVLIPVADLPPSVPTVDILAATTRAPSDAPGVVFTGERGDSLSFANVVVSIPPDRTPGSLQWPSGPQANPQREFAVAEIAPVPRADVGAWLARSGKRRVLVFVHGFNTRFDASVFRFAQIVHDMDAGLAPVLFSWPSRGRIVDYVYDRESANFSRSDLAYVLTAAARSPKVDEVIVMAHSMGAWLTVEALRQMALRDGRIPSKISSVVLASPDLDVDVFRRQVEEMGSHRPAITIFVSRTDHALSVSSLISGGITRVGAIDLAQEPYRSQLEGAKGITVVDLTAVQNGDSLNHSKFATSPEIVQALGTRVMSGQNFVEPGESLIGEVITAPIRVVTGGMRN
ncbi:MAG: alpha/beta hydrolase [Pseudomonadota bacterium]